MPTEMENPDILKEAKEMLETRKLSEKWDKGEMILPSDNLELLERQVYATTAKTKVIKREGQYITRLGNIVPITAPYGEPGVYSWPSTRDMWGLELSRLGDDIKKERTTLRWTKKRLAQLSRQSSQTIARVELGRTTNISAYFKTAEALGIKIRIM